MARTIMKNHTDLMDRYVLKDHYEYGRNSTGRFMFDGSTVYSYGKHWPLTFSYDVLKGINTDGSPNWEERYVVNDNYYSSSTNRHKRAVIDGLNRHKRKYVTARNPQDRELMNHIYKYVMKRLSHDLGRDGIDIHEPEQECKKQITESIEQHLLKQLIKSIRSRKYKADEKKLIRDHQRLTKTILDIPKQREHRHLSRIANELALKDLYDKEITLDDMKQLCESIAYCGDNLAQRQNTSAFYNHMISKHKFDRMEIEGEIMMNKLAQQN